MITSIAERPIRRLEHRDQPAQVRRRVPPIAGILLGALALLPIQFVDLPYNLAPLDAWIIFTLPLSCWYLLRRRQAVRLPYLGAIWLILLGSLVGTLVGVDPAASILAIVKDTYLYAWFVLVAALLSTFDRREQHVLMRVWLTFVLAHGALLVAQFVSPEFYQLNGAIASRYGELDRFRPSGLFNNANGAALYQLLGFLPLVEARLPRIVASAAAMVIVASIVATGSLAAAVGFLVGLAVTITGLILRREALGLSARVLLDVLILTALLGGLIFTGAAGQTEAMGDRFQRLFYGRFEGSAEGRFDLWERGTDLLATNSVILGIGPNAYRSVDVMQKTLHNDILAFTVERGVIGAAGLGLLAVLSLRTAIQLVRRPTARSAPKDRTAVIFLAAITVVIVESLFHQVFHERAVWFALAAQEALRWRVAHEEEGSACKSS